MVERETDYTEKSISPLPHFNDKMYSCMALGTNDFLSLSVVHGIMRSLELIIALLLCDHAVECMTVFAQDGEQFVVR